MIQPDAEVIIIGAGPAGAIAAYELSLLGIRVLILEKSSFPRYKVCGAGLTHKVLAEIPYDISPVIETTIYNVRFSCNFSEVYTRSGTDPVMHCTMRDRFDSFLLDKAVHSGAEIKTGVKVTDIRSGDTMAEVITRDRSYKCLLVIGADGASGITSIKTGLRRNIELGLAWEAELKISSQALELFRNTVFLDWGTFPGGYAWLFPKLDHVSVGVGGPARLADRMLPYYDKFLKSIENEIRVEKTISLKAWPIPVRTQYAKFNAGRVLVAGDAGGLSDPLTGEGIYYAIRSGRFAADACSSFLGGKPESLSRYSDRVNEELMQELLAAKKIRRIFNAIPVPVHHWVRDNDRVWRAFAKVLRGERNYRDVRKRFGKWKFLWNPAIWLSSGIAWIREKIFSI